jgi:hypothetical protein
MRRMQPPVRSSTPWWKRPGCIALIAVWALTLPVVLYMLGIVMHALVERG